MGIKVTDEGGIYHLGVMFGSTPKPTSFSLKLITDNNTLADGDTISTHTVADGGGYADKTLTNNATVSLNSGIPEAEWPQQIFTFTGPLTGNPTIYGYQIIAGTTLLHEELFAESFTPGLVQNELKFTPKFQFGNGVPS